MGISGRLNDIYGHGGAVDAFEGTGEQASPTQGGLNPQALSQEEPSSHSAEEPSESEFSHLSEEYAGAAGPSSGENVDSPAASVGGQDSENASKGLVDSRGSGHNSRGLAEPNSTRAKGQGSGSEHFQNALNSGKFSDEEMKLMQKHNLQYERHNEQAIYLSAPAEQEHAVDPDKSNYWYRTMNQSEFNHVKQSKNNGELPLSDSYQGIATSRKYVTDKKYYNNNSDGKYTVEWHSPGLAQNMKAQGINPKAEDGDMSFGLGAQGTPSSHPSQTNPATAHQVFSEFAGPRFQVTNARLDNNGRLPHSKKNDE